MQTKTKLLILWGLLQIIWLYTSLFSGTVSASSIPTTIQTTTVEATTEVTTQATTATTVFSETSTAVQAEIPRKLEEYVVGVVAAEMPPYFPMEALKAQAVAARTYAYREYTNNKNVDLKTIGQAYLSTEALKSRWGSDFDKHYSKICKAVTSTQGELILYNNEPILAAFCSASKGVTEASENVWGKALPYLKSVQSDMDEKAPVYLQKITISKERLSALLRVADVQNFIVTKRSAAGYVISAQAGGTTFSGNEIRNALGLRSTAFEISAKNNCFEITTLGYGHGVGMSQYGACYMAENGSSYIDILNHYYTDVYIEKCSIS